MKPPANSTVRRRIEDPKAMDELWNYIADHYGAYDEITTSEIIEQLDDDKVTGLTGRSLQDVLQAAMLRMAESPRFPIIRISRGHYRFT